METKETGEKSAVGGGEVWLMDSLHLVPGVGITTWLAGASARMNVSVLQYVTTYTLTLTINISVP